MKRFFALLLAVLMIVSLTACGNSSDESESASVRDNIDIKGIKDTIISELSIEGAYDMDEAMLLNMYGIEEAWVEECACFTTMDGVFPDEIIMVKAADKDAADKVQEKLNTRLEAVLTQSQNYDAENYAIAQKCKVIREGQVVALFISANHETMQEIFMR